MITLTRLVATAALVTTVACAGCSKTEAGAQADATPKFPGRQRELKRTCRFTTSRS